MCSYCTRQNADCQQFRLPDLDNLYHRPFGLFVAEESVALCRDELAGLVAKVPLHVGNRAVFVQADRLGHVELVDGVGDQGYTGLHRRSASADDSVVITFDSRQSAGNLTGVLRRGCLLGTRSSEVQSD